MHWANYQSVEQVFTFKHEIIYSLILLSDLKVLSLNSKPQFYLENSLFQFWRTDNGQTIKNGPGQFSDP